MMRSLFFLVFLTAVLLAGFVSAQDWKPAYDVVRRVTPKAVDQVKFEEDRSLDGFSLENADGKLLIKAPHINNMTAAYGYFLRQYQNAEFSWNGNRMPEVIEPSLIKEKVIISQPWETRFAYNYCTLTYTSAFWGRHEWEAEIDRLALNGFNQALIQAGLEKTWQLVLRELKYPEEKISSFIPNPSAAAWWNMGNLEGLGGPVSQNVIDGEADLGRFIADRMRSLGITPVLQGFVGLVPHDLDQYVKGGDARYMPQGNWVDGFQRPAVLDPTTETFCRIAEIWYEKLHEVYGGPTSVYGGDLFHEGGKSGGINVTDAARSVQKAMQKASAGSTWIIQAWGHNPSKALLEGLDKEHSRIISLVMNMHKGNEGSYFKGYQGVPWVWCELMNFGGNHGMYGGLKVMAGLDKLQESPDKENLKGLGLLSEGTETNPVYYELFFQRFWMPKDYHMDEAALKAWLKRYAENRYGIAPEELLSGLDKLESSVYSPDRQQEGCTESILCARPARNARKASTWASSNIYYDFSVVHSAALDYLTAGQKYPELLKQNTFRYDLVDVVRQFASDTARPLLHAVMQAYDAEDKAEFVRLSGLYLSMMDDLDALLGTYPQWRFGHMYERAVAKGKTKSEKENMAAAVKRLVTTWTGRIGSLNDYSHRQLEGLMKDFYGHRWQIFFDTYAKALDGRIKPEEIDAAFRKADYEFEVSWETSAKSYSSRPVGDIMELAARIMEKYGPLATELEDMAARSKGHQWTLRDGGATFSFDVSDSITSPGTYTAAFQWEQGQNALEISRVALYEGDKLVSEDSHPGWTGLENRRNVYKLPVSKLREGLDAYVIKAEVKGANGTDSMGKMIFTKVAE